MRFSCERPSRLWALLLAVGLQLLLTLLRTQGSVLNSASFEDTSLPVVQKAGHKGVIAYALSFTQCPNNTLIEVLDAPAVLAHSIHLNSYRNNKKSAYDYHLVAFVHPLALNCTQHLPALGFEVRVLSEPVSVADIGDRLFHKWVQAHGCCGAREFMKLYAYVLEEFPVVVHLDADVILLQPMDELYDAMISNDVSGVATLHPKPEQQDQFDFFYTRDYIQMSSISVDPRKYAVQGGFFVVRPNVTIFSEMKELVTQGGYGRRMGWGKKHYGGYWGDAQIQGFLSYFYGEFYPNRALELHPCIYSTLQGFTPRHKGGICRYGNTTYCPDCSITNMADMKLSHFTNCYKPWWCPKARALQLCRDVHAAWFTMRRSLEESLGIVNLPVNDSSKIFDRFRGYCTNFKRENYIPMNLTNVNMTANPRFSIEAP